MQADYLDVQIKPGKTWKLRTEPENTVFIYIIEGGLQLANGTALPRPCRFARDLKKPLYALADRGFLRCKNSQIAR
ncbi:hypothetical protein LJC36_03515 [Desulfovibrio sp. OttesenSCG-928-C14]|nr:hypothetical protein [Desulfovibrio sp. OttesenSCG-928-C14]